MTAHLPVYFAISLLVATVLDFVAAVVSFSAHPDDNVGAAIKIVSAFIRPGMMTLLLIGVLVFALLRGHTLDERAQETYGQARRSRRTPAATIAAWIAIIGPSILIVVAIFLGMDIAEGAKHFPDPERPADQTIDLIIAGLVAIGIVLLAIPAVFGVLVLRQRTWARYGLIAYCAVAGVGIALWPLLQMEPLITYATIAVAALLIWAELRERTRMGSFRNCWRGLLLLFVDIHVVIIYVIAAIGTNDDSAFAGLAIINLSMTISLLIALLLAMWAANKDENDFFSGLNAGLVVATPLLASVVGFAAALIEVLMPSGIS